MSYKVLFCFSCIYNFDGFCESRNSGKYFVSRYDKCKEFKKVKNGTNIIRNINICSDTVSVKR